MNAEAMAALAALFGSLLGAAIAYGASQQKIKNQAEAHKELRKDFENFFSDFGKWRDRVNDAQSSFAGTSALRDAANKETHEALRFQINGVGAKVNATQAALLVYSSDREKIAEMFQRK